VRRTLLLVIAALGCVVCTCFAQQFGNAQRRDVKWLYEAIKNSDSVDILEGLPHKYWEADARATEASKPNIIKIRDELFYPKALEVPVETKNKLTEQFLQQNLFTVPETEASPFTTQGCGGFHADYAVRWNRNGDTLAAALICFGCEQVLLVNDKTTVMANFAPEGKTLFTATLKPHRQSRPVVNKFGNSLVPKPELFKPPVPSKSGS
jgi:hypothetical protein